MQIGTNEAIRMHPLYTPSPSPEPIPEIIVTPIKPYTPPDTPAHERTESPPNTPAHERTPTPPEIPTPPVASRTRQQTRLKYQ